MFLSSVIWLQTKVKQTYWSSKINQDTAIIPKEKFIHTYMHTHTHTILYIYTYKERERERENLGMLVNILTWVKLFNDELYLPIHIWLIFLNETFQNLFHSLLCTNIINLKNITFQDPSTEWRKYMTKPTNYFWNGALKTYHGFSFFSYWRYCQYTVQGSIDIWYNLQNNKP